MRRPALTLVLFAIAGLGVRAPAQRPAPLDDPRYGMLRDALAGVLASNSPVPDSVAAHRCVALPRSDVNDGITGPRGDTLISAHCDIIAYERVDAGAQWSIASYRRTSVYTAEHATSTTARDTIVESESVVFTQTALGARPVWHARFESDPYGVWRSITPEFATPSPETTLLSVMYCLNGTGGCTQEFLARHADGAWSPVWQAWMDQLPAGYRDKLWHGFHVDPRTLRGDAGFYAPGDGNCCPSATLAFELTLRADSLLLRAHRVVRDSTARSPSSTPIAYH